MEGKMIGRKDDLNGRQMKYKDIIQKLSRSTGYQEKLKIYTK